MKFSQKCHYALRVMLHLSAAYPSDRVHIDDLAERRDIPSKFLGQILLRLKKKGLIESKKGPNGGYRLKMSPSEIRVGEVIRIMEKSFSPEDSITVDKRGQKEDDGCRQNGFYGLFEQIDTAVSSVIDHISFEDIRKREAECHAKAAAGYSYII